MKKSDTPIGRLNTLAINEALQLLKGKWRVLLICSLNNKPNSRFNDLLSNIDGIGSKMLTTDLKFLETHNIIARSIISTSPVIIAYALTDYGSTLYRILHEMSNWGTQHLALKQETNTPNEFNHLLTITI